MSEPMAYACRWPGCDHFSAAIRDDPDHTDCTARIVAHWIREGFIVERVAYDVVRAELRPRALRGREEHADA